MAKKSTRISWKKIFSPEGQLPVIMELLQANWKRYRVGMSTRELFYSAIDTLWPNTVSAYKQVSSYVSKSCKEGVIPWNLIRDGSGREIHGISTTASDPDDHLDSRIKWLEEAVEDYWIPMWYQQPQLPVILLEKESDYHVIRQLARRWQVSVGYLRGFSGWQVIYDISEYIKQQTAIGHEVHILWLGDFDPAGEALREFALSALRELNAEFIFTNDHVMGITYQQYITYSLQDEPLTVEEHKKFARQQGYAEWVARYLPFHPEKDGEIRAETAAFRTPALQDEFDAAIYGAIESHFHSGIHKQALQLQGARKEWIHCRLNEYQGWED